MPMMFFLLGVSFTALCHANRCVPDCQCSSGWCEFCKNSKVEIKTGGGDTRCISDGECTPEKVNPYEPDYSYGAYVHCDEACQNSGRTIRKKCQGCEPFKECSHNGSHVIGTACPEGKYFDPVSTFNQNMIGFCFDSCPNGSFASGKTCVACASNCNTCSDNSTCTDCKEATYLSNNNCVSTCPDGTFPSSGKCEACKADCATCDNSTMCTGCAGGKVLQGGTCLAKTTPASNNDAPASNNNSASTSNNSNKNGSNGSSNTTGVVMASIAPKVVAAPLAVVAVLLGWAS